MISTRLVLRQTYRGGDAKILTPPVLGVKFVAVKGFFLTPMKLGVVRMTRLYSDAWSSG